MKIDAPLVFALSHVGAQANGWAELVWDKIVPA